MAKSYISLKIRLSASAFCILAFGMYYINLKVYITHEWKFETVLNVLFIAIVISFVLAITAAIKGIIKTL